MPNLGNVDTALPRPAGNSKMKLATADFELGSA